MPMDHWGNSRKKSAGALFGHCGGHKLDAINVIYPTNTVVSRKLPKANRVGDGKEHFPADLISCSLPHPALSFIATLNDVLYSEQS